MNANSLPAMVSVSIDGVSTRTANYIRADMVRPGTVAAPLPDGMTPKRLQMIALAANGYCAKRMAREMRLTVKQIQHHLAEARKATDAVNTTHLVAIALRSGWI